VESTTPAGETTDGCDKGVLTNKETFNSGYLNLRGEGELEDESTLFVASGSRCPAADSICLNHKATARSILPGGLERAETVYVYDSFYATRMNLLKTQISSSSCGDIHIL